MHLSTEEFAASMMLEPFGEVGGDVPEHILLKLKIKKLLRKIKSKNLTAGVFFFFFFSFFFFHSGFNKGHRLFKYV